MLISEMYLLMLLDGCKGKIFSGGRANKDLGLAGAMILDLYLRGRLSIYGKKSRILYYQASGYPYLDKILGFLYRSKRPLKLRTWVKKISLSYKHASLCFCRHLESQGILISDFKSKRFYLSVPEIKDSLLEQISNVFVNNINPGIEILCLLSLMKVCDLIKVYFRKTYTKFVERRIKELLYSQYYAPETREMIFMVLKIIKDLIKARNATCISF